jgi:diketogulonate reductase-like aldo/keto reductase
MGNLIREDTVLTVQGTEIPRLGYGTWQVTGKDATEGVRDALEIGYRHIDTARAYENEAEVGEGLADSGVDRGDIFLTTKIWLDDFEPSKLKAAAEDSLRKLRTDYVDLLLLHWPSSDVPMEQSLQAMQELREAGKIRHAGVSNFPAGMLARALEVSPLLANQVEYHPFLAQDRLLALAEERDLTLTAYSPLAHGKVVGHPELTEIGEQYGKSAGQVALRWLLDQPYVTTLPKASSHERRLENFDVFDFHLSDADRERIAALPKDVRTANPSWAPDWED